MTTRNLWGRMVLRPRWRVDSCWLSAVRLALTRIGKTIASAGLRQIAPESIATPVITASISPQVDHDVARMDSDRQWSATITRTGIIPDSTLVFTSGTSQDG